MTRRRPQACRTEPTPAVATSQSVFTGNRGLGESQGQNGGGAIFLFGAASFNTYNCTFRNNSGGVRGPAMGGAILAQASQAYIRNSTFSGNLATIVRVHGMMGTW